jgi:hypothetical protein
MSKRILSWLIVLVIVAALFGTQGCSIHFKASDVELETIANSTFEFDGVGWYGSETGRRIAKGL